MPGSAPFGFGDGDALGNTGGSSVGAAAGRPDAAGAGGPATLCPGDGVGWLTDGCVGLETPGAGGWLVRRSESRPPLDPSSTMTVTSTPTTAARADALTASCR